MKYLSFENLPTEMALVWREEQTRSHFIGGEPANSREPEEIDPLFVVSILEVVVMRITTNKSQQQQQ